MQKSQSVIIFTIIIMAIILGVGSFLALSYVRRRPELPAGSFQTTVEGVDVVVSLDPAKQILLLNPPPLPSDLPPGDQTTEPAAGQSAQGQPPPTATPPPPEPTPTPIPDAVIFVDYLVQANDSMYSVAQRMDTSITLMAQEGIAQDNLIPGQTIKLPIGNPAYCPGQRPYAVGEGDTAFSVSRRFNMTVEALKTINNLDENYTILAGGILCMP